MNCFCRALLCGLLSRCVCVCVCVGCAVYMCVIRCSVNVQLHDGSVLFCRKLIASRRRRWRPRPCPRNLFTAARLDGLGGGTAGQACGSVQARTRSTPDKSTDRAIKSIRNAAVAAAEFGGGRGGGGEKNNNIKTGRRPRPRRDRALPPRERTIRIIIIILLFLLLLSLLLYYNLFSVSLSPLIWPCFSIRARPGRPNSAARRPLGSPEGATFPKLVISCLHIYAHD